MSFRTNQKGGFNDLTKAYKRTPSIENYVKLRRENPTGEIEISIMGGIDALFYMEPELRQHGIDPELVVKAMDANPDAISEISLLVLEKMIEAGELRKAGRSHLTSRGLTIPEKLIDWLIACSLDALSWNDDLHIPRDLIVLIRERLGGSNPEYRQAAHAHEKKVHAAFLAGQLKARGTKPTYRLLGRALGVAPSTVKRWFKPGEFEQQAEHWSKLFDERGNLIPFAKFKK